MFGYITINKAEMKFKDYDVYRSYYCGLCRELKSRYGLIGQAALSNDMTFLLMLLTGLYEPLTKEGSCKCLAHPFEKHQTRMNEITGYVADMNILLMYLKYEDDWADDHKYRKYLNKKMLGPKYRQVETMYREKSAKVSELMRKIYIGEQAKEEDIDLMAGYFGGIMAEIFTYKQDEWHDTLSKMGFYLGKFIYLVDAYDDIEEDLKKGSYNPFARLYGKETFEQDCKQILTMMMTECSREFEKLPIIEYVDTLRNVLYSGVWCRYEAVSERRKKEQEETNAGSI